MLDPIEILVQSIQYEREELLRVVLLCARELLSKPDDLFLLSALIRQKRHSKLTRNVTGDKNV